MGNSTLKKITLLSLIFVNGAVLAAHHKSVVCRLDDTGAEVSVLVKRNMYPELGEPDGVRVIFQTGENKILSEYFEKIGLVSEGKNKEISIAFIPASGVLRQDGSHPFDTEISIIGPRYSAFSAGGGKVGEGTHITLFLDFEDRGERVHISIPEPEITSPDFEIEKNLCTVTDSDQI